MAPRIFAYAAHRCLLDGILGVRLPGSTFHPRFKQIDAFGVFVVPGADLAHTAERIQRHFVGRYPLYVLTRGRFKERVLELVEQPFAVTYALEIIAIVVALLGVTNALYASILECTRKLGVLRAVGTTRQRVWRMVLIEGGNMGLVGGCCGLVAGVFLSLILIVVINRQVFGWTLQVTIPLPFALGTLVLLVLATIAAASAEWQVGKTEFISHFLGTAIEKPRECSTYLGSICLRPNATNSALPRA